MVFLGLTSFKTVAHEHNVHLFRLYVVREFFNGRTEKWALAFCLRLLSMTVMLAVIRRMNEILIIIV
jgi:hypothetical protein